MQRYEFRPSTPDAPLQLTRFNPAPLGDTEVAVAIKAVSLNYRDLLAVRNTYFSPIPDGRVPCSDGAGEVVAVGSKVSHLKVGDRVATLFFRTGKPAGPITATSPARLVPNPTAR